MILGLNDIKNWIKGWSQSEPPTERPCEYPKTCLLLLLEPQLKLGLATRGEIKGLEIGNTTYKKGSCAFMFHDWLVSEEGSLIGVRCCGVDHSFLDALRGLSYLRVGNYGELEIFFSAKKKYDPGQSSHQSFLVEELFAADSGQYALALSMDDLPFGAADEIRRSSAFHDALLARHARRGRGQLI